MGYFVLEFEIYLSLMNNQAARQPEFFKGRSNHNTDLLADALAIAQHHDAVTDTEKQHVQLMITQNVCSSKLSSLSLSCPSVIYLFKIYVQAEELAASSLACLAQSASDTECGNPSMKFQQVKYYELQLVSYFNSFLNGSFYCGIYIAICITLIKLFKL